MQNCYNTGERIPREKKFDQDERLANKHIQTLQFVQEVVNENKALKNRVEELELSQLNCDELHKLAEESKEKIKLIQEQYMKRADEINAMMAEKHRDEMMQVVHEKLAQEQKYSEEMVQLKTEVNQMENTNRDLMARINELSGSHEKIEVLNAEIEDLKRVIGDLRMELEGVRGENEQLSGEKTTQFSQLQNLQSLKSQNESLAQDLKAMAYKNLELSHKVSQLEADLKEASVARDQAELIDNLKNKLGKLHKERAIVVEKEEFYQKQIGELKYEMEKLRENVQSADVTKDRVLEEYYRVLKELQYLKKNYSNDSESQNFKEFVKLKREIALLKQENTDLKKNSKNLAGGDGPVGFPMLKFESAAPIAKISAERKSNRSKKAVSLPSKA